MTSAFSWRNSASLFPASFCTPRPNLPVILGISTSYFCIPIPCDEKNIFFIFLVLLVFIELINFRYFGISGWGFDLDYCDVEWFASEMN